VQICEHPPPNPVLGSRAAKVDLQVSLWLAVAQTTPEVDITLSRSGDI